jgi:DEAD/DEAH box helicase domain-containing protein
MSMAETWEDRAGSLARVLDGLAGVPGRDGCLRHVERIDARPARHADWPDWVDDEVRAAWDVRGVARPWTHQAEAAELAHAGRHVVLATSTASGKSLGFQLPAVCAVREPLLDPRAPRRTVLYLSPTKALAADQLASLRRLVEDGGLDGVRPGVYDGDTPTAERQWIRRHANIVLTNPDMLHYGILPGHAQWAAFLRALTLVVVDEAHTYRGVFGSHVALVLRRLRRAARRYGAEPTFVLASATVSDPELSSARLVGDDVVAVTDDGSPHGGLLFALWEPAELHPEAEPDDGGDDVRNEVGDDPSAEDADSDAPDAADGTPGETRRRALPPVRRSATAEAAALLADLVAAGRQSLVFARSRRGTEVVSRTARRILAQRAEETRDPRLADASTRIAAYRGGYLAEERRVLEQRLRSGELMGLASTSALELGIDISGLDAVVVAGWPGTRASLWQQAGRAGRTHRAGAAGSAGALAIFVARDDPLDQYVVDHPETVFATPVEAAVLDPSNPYVLMPHLCSAASEFPLVEADLDLFGPDAAEVLDVLVRQKALRRRPGGWFWTLPQRPQDLADLRGSGGEPFRIVESATGQLLGTIDAGSAHEQVHDGAVYVHQGTTFVVEHLDVDALVAFMRREDPLVTTQARSTSEIRVRGIDEERTWGGVRVRTGTVEVTDQVVGYQVRDVYTGAVLGSHALDLPSRTLVTKAVWYEVPPELTETAGIAPGDLPGALHAAEHAAIGLLPLLATCDRWDIGGVSTALHEDTGVPTVFVYDGAEGGAGFAARGYHAMRAWISATRDAVASCPCAAGCPSCVQSPKCGNGNEPLSKSGAVTLLDLLLEQETTGAGQVPAG